MKICIYSIIIISMLINCKSIYTKIEIQAHKSKVWNALIDLKNYEDWNPYHVKVIGIPKVGETLIIHINKPNGNSLIIEPKVQKIIPQKELTWGGGIPLLFTGKHVFEIKEKDANSVLLIHREKFKGLFVLFAELDTIEEGYNLMNRALKKKVEE